MYYLEKVERDVVYEAAANDAGICFPDVHLFDV